MAAWHTNKSVRGSAAGTAHTERQSSLLTRDCLERSCLNQKNTARGRQETSYNNIKGKNGRNQSWLKSNAGLTSRVSWINCKACRASAGSLERRGRCDVAFDSRAGLQSRARPRPRLLNVVGQIEVGAKEGVHIGRHLRSGARERLARRKGGKGAREKRQVERVGRVGGKGGEKRWEEQHAAERCRAVSSGRDEVSGDTGHRKESAGETGRRGEG
eukprot:6202162-Pleurochrysis_carterae.AAC.9